ncbi:MAG: SDR family oxidoreductase [Pseudomonadota bacterium]
MSKRPLDGKTALITGGSRGIGRAIVDRFLAEGANVVTCGRSERPGDLAEAAGWSAADLSQSEDVQALCAATLDAHGSIDVLVNNSGVQIEKTVPDTTDEDWDQLMGVNARGLFECCRAVIPLMADAGGGVIINIGSISGNQADPGMALYNASKAFVHGLTRSIAVDHGKDGIRCNAISPGWIMTGMADAAFDLADDPAAAKKDALARHAAGRFGAPSDIANAAYWLASDDAAFVTGQCFVVDGGLTAATPLQPGLF